MLESTRLHGEKAESRREVMEGERGPLHRLEETRRRAKQPAEGRSLTPLEALARAGVLPGSMIASAIVSRTVSAKTGFRRCAAVASGMAQGKLATRHAIRTRVGVTMSQLPRQL